MINQLCFEGQESQKNFIEEVMLNLSLEGCVGISLANEWKMALKTEGTAKHTCVKWMY